LVWILAICRVNKAARQRCVTAAGSQQRAFLKDVGRAYQGTTLGVISEDTPASKVTRQLIEEEFTALTGIKVEWELTLLARVLVAAESESASHCARMTGPEHGQPLAYRHAGQGSSNGMLNTGTASERLSNADSAATPMATRVSQAPYSMCV
jgi:hypothetical protein